MVDLDISKIKSWYRSSAKFVHNTDDVLRLIKLFNLDTSKDIFTVMGELNVIYKLKARQHDIVSEINYGAVKKETELWISTDFEYDYLNMENAWEEMIPIRPIRTDLSTLNLDHPLNANMSVCVYEIDIRALLVMWYHFKRTFPDKNLGNFVYNYVYVNMIPIFFDLAFFNLMSGATEVLIPDSHPFYITNHSPRGNRLIKTIKRNISKRPMWYPELLQNIPCISAPTMYDVVFTTQRIYTRQNELATFIARSEILINIMRLGNTRSDRMNKQTFKDIYIKLTRMESRNILSSADYEIFNIFADIDFEVLLDAGTNHRIKR
jgi:hypothetical protein